MAREGSTASDARDRRRHRPKDAMWRRFGRYRRETCPGVGVPLAFANKEWWSTAEVPIRRNWWHLEKPFPYLLGREIFGSFQ